MVGRGKWKVINGKLSNTELTNQSSSSTTTSRFSQDNALKYGSLDRRILSKHRHSQASLSRTNSCENVDDLSASTQSLKRTSPVQLSSLNRIGSMRESRRSRTDINNNNDEGPGSRRGSTSDVSSAVNRNTTNKVLEKWKNLERSKTGTSSMSTLSKSQPNTPKLPRRSLDHSRTYCESSDTDTEKAPAFTRNTRLRKSESSIRIRSTRTPSPRSSTSSDSNVENVNTEKLPSIEQVTNQIQRLSDSVHESRSPRRDRRQRKINKEENVNKDGNSPKEERVPLRERRLREETSSQNDTTKEKTSPSTRDTDNSTVKRNPKQDTDLVTNKNTTKDTSSNVNDSPKGDQKKRERRSPNSTRRSRSPTNAIIVRRKSIKNITLSQPSTSDSTKTVESSQKLSDNTLNETNTSKTEDHQTKRRSLSEMTGLKLNTTSAPQQQQQNSRTSTTESVIEKTDSKSETDDKVETPKLTRQRKTADGKPIGYATKIMGSPNLRQSRQDVQRQDSSTGYVNTGGDIIPDSPEKIQNDLDSYIEQSFRDIEKQMRRRRRQSEETTSTSPTTKTSNPDISELRRERRREKNRERQMRLEMERDDVFRTPTPEQIIEKPSNDVRQLSSKTNRNKLEAIKSQEETIFRPESPTTSTPISPVADFKTDSTMDTMKEFEEFLRKQEKKTKRQMKRLSKSSSFEMKSKSQEDISGQTKEITVEQYRKTQEQRRKERKEFQQKHLKERRLSLGNKWPSLGNIGNSSSGGKRLERKLSLPANLNHTQRFAMSSSSLSTTSNSSTESLDEKEITVIERPQPRTPSGRHSAPPTNLSRRHSFSGLTEKQRSNSTGHSPDIDSLLQHLICDIEEEVVSSDDEQGPRFKRQDQQVKSFNSNLNQLKSQSEEALNRSNSLPRLTSKAYQRRVASEDQLRSQQEMIRRRLRQRKQQKQQAIDNVERPGNHLYSSGNTRQIEVFLLLDQDQKTKDAFKIETINIDRSISYRDIENSIIEGFNKHLQLLDQQKLDINREDIAYLQMAQHKISIGSPFDLSQVNIENGYLPCQMFLKGNNEWSLASMAYDTLIPKTYLEKYVSLILTHRQVVFYGPSGTGKSYIARRIATIISHRMNNNTIPMLTYKNMTPEQWKDLLKDLKNNKRNQPYVILVDGFASNFIKQGKDLTEIISTSESIHPQPYVICTLTQSPNYEIPSTWQNNFKWIWLPNHEEPINGVLQRFLRRRYTQHGHKDTYQEVFRVADWLAETWRYINTILEKFNSAECTIGPTMFYTCPIDINAAEEWFIDLWNYSITPYFLHAIKCGIKLYGQRHQWIDPLDWILKSYPWKPNTTPGKVDKKTKLRRIRPEDVGFQTSCNNTQPQVDSESEKQRLLDFLRQLEILMRDGGLGELPNFEQSSQYESSI